MPDLDVFCVSNEGSVVNYGHFMFAVLIPLLHYDIIKGRAAIYRLKMNVGGLFRILTAVFGSRVQAKYIGKPDALSDRQNYYDLYINLLARPRPHAILLDAMDVFNDSLFKLAAPEFDAREFAQLERAYVAGDRKKRVRFKALYITDKLHKLRAMLPVVRTFFDNRVSEGAGRDAPEADVVVIVRRPPDRIGGDLVTNAGGARRVVANHAAVLTKIEAACGTEASVASVCMEELDIFAQYRVFRGARVVVAQHGAALSNIVFCRPGALVVEITPELGNNAWHKNLADFCDVNYVGVPQLAITMRDWRAMHIEVASDVDVSHVFAHMNDAEMYYHPLAAFFRNSGRTSAAAVAKAVKAGLGLGSGSRRSAEINWI